MRLTPDPNNPVLAADIVSSQIYPVGFNDEVSLPLYDGSTMTRTQFTSGLTNNVGPVLDLSLDTAGTIWPPGTIYDLYMMNASGSVIFGSVPWVNGLPAVPDAFWLGTRVNSADMTITYTQGGQIKQIDCPVGYGTYVGTMQVDNPQGSQILAPSAYVATSHGNTGYSYRQWIGNSPGGAGGLLTGAFNSCPDAAWSASHVSALIATSGVNGVAATLTELKFSGQSGFTIAAGAPPLAWDPTPFTSTGPVMIVADVTSDAMPRNGAGIAGYDQLTQSWNEATPPGSWNGFAPFYGIYRAALTFPSVPSLTFTASYGLYRQWPLWNYRNRRTIRLLAGQSNTAGAPAPSMGAPYNFLAPNPALLRPVAGNPGNSFRVLIGRAEENVNVTFPYLRRTQWLAGDTQELYMVGIDWGNMGLITVPNGVIGSINWELQGGFSGPQNTEGGTRTARYTSGKFAGSIPCTAVENVNGSGCGSEPAQGSMMLEAAYNG